MGVARRNAPRVIDLKRLHSVGYQALVERRERQIVRKCSSASGSMTVFKCGVGLVYRKKSFRHMCSCNVLDHVLSALALGGSIRALLCF